MKNYIAYLGMNVNLFLARIRGRGICSQAPAKPLTIIYLSDTFTKMETFLSQHGYTALFATSFLAATLLPIGSEWLLVTMLLKQHDPVLAVAVASIGNYLGACVTYAVGIYGGSFLIRRVLRISEEAESRGQRIFARYGSWTLLFSWVPVIGDPLCLVGGIMRIGFGRFSLLVAGGKVTRYAAVAWLTLHGQVIFA